MKAISLILLLATVAWGTTLAWDYADPELIDYFIIYRAHPDSLDAFARIDTALSDRLVIVVPQQSVVYVTAVDTAGTESAPSIPYFLFRLPPAPTNVRVIFEFSLPPVEPGGNLNYD